MIERIPVTTFVLSTVRNSSLIKTLLKYITPQLTLALFSLAVAAALFFLHVPLHMIFEMPVPMDFEVPILARDRFLQGINPYIPEEFLPYKYSPFAVVPMILLPKDHTAAWFYYKIVCVLSLAATLYYGFRPITWKRVGLAVLGVIFAWKGFTMVLYYGQLEFIMYLLAVVAVIVFRKSLFWSGVIIGMMPWLKLPFGFMFIPFLIEAARMSYQEKSYKKFLQLCTGLGVSAVLYGFLIPGAAFGFSETIEHTKNWYLLVKTQPQALFEEPLNQSVWIAAWRWLGPVGHSIWVKGALILATLAAIYLIAQRHMKRWDTRSPLVWITPWILLNQIINPLAWVWGGLYVMGAPLALEDSEKKSTQPVWLKSVLWVMVIIGLLLQQRGLPQFLGVETWEGLFQYGSLSFYWLAVLGLLL